MLRAISKATGPIRRRVLLMVSRTVVRLVAEAEKCQRLQLGALSGETLDGVERWQEYGFSSVPLPGAEAAIVCVGGNRNHPIAVAVEDRRYRPRGQPAGDVMLYSDEDDPAAGALSATSRLQITRGRTLVGRFDRIDLKCGATRIEMDATGITITTPRLDIVKA